MHKYEFTLHVWHELNASMFLKPLCADQLVILLQDFANFEDYIFWWIKGLPEIYDNLCTSKISIYVTRFAKTRHYGAY